ncbi:MAG: zf-HC2 domain-containing protein [Fimbriimonadales bacterium]|nr:zf-HC2 domain-containing protein [Fimbriimonadales bacterium]
MRCEHFRNIINEYIEGSLGDAMRDQAQAHLNRCEACQRELRFMQSIWRGLSTAPAVKPPADLHARIMTHVRANTRVRQAQQRVAFWRWAGAVAMAAGLFGMGFLAARSDGVQAAFGFGSSRPPAAEMPAPVPAGVFVVYRATEEGLRLPVLEARMNRAAAAELHYVPEAGLGKPMLVWKGTLQPSKTVEIPLRTLLQYSKERVLTLRWSVDGLDRVLYIPAGYPPAKIASVRLQAKLSDALRQLASVYQTPIEWVPNCAEPLVVLDVRDATLEDALRQLLIGTTYTLKRHGEAWRVMPQQ